MRKRVFEFLRIGMGVIVGGCVSPSDPLEHAAMQASRVGTSVGELDQGRSTAGLEAGSRVAEEYYFIAKYEATGEQRTIAAEVAKHVTPRIATSPRPSARGKLTATRYIAVKTKSDARAKSKTSVMLWDTQSEEIVGNNVYDLNASPPTGTMVKFDTFAAEFVGSGR